ncbi:MAG: AMP-binding protein [Candidatus Yanofskybacteria bacterium]|nr:AMP-binding protein [Candidatus Yanofskybacteria bacterium]
MQDIIEVFFENVKNNPSRTAMVLIKKDGSIEKISWADYLYQAIKYAESFRLRGAKEGDFIAIVGFNHPISFFAMTGAILVGAVPVPLNALSVKEAGLGEIKSILDDCKPRISLAPNSLLQQLSGLSFSSVEWPAKETVLGFLPGNPQISEYDGLISVAPLDSKYRKKGSGDMLIMPYTSGTSGDSRGKGVMLTHGNVLDRVIAIRDELRVTSKDRLFSYNPLSHIAELIATFFGQIVVGYPVYFSEYSLELVHDREGFRKQFPNILSQVKPTIFLGVPKVWINIRREIERKTRWLGWIPDCLRLLPNELLGPIIKRKLGFAETRYFISSADKLEDEHRRFFRELLGIEIQDVWGQTEIAGPGTINGLPIGKIIIGIDDDGEMFVYGPSIMAGYYNNPEADKKVFRLGTREVYWTGDEGRRDGEKIFCLGRKDDGFKMSQGEFVTAERLGHLEEEIKRINPDGIHEVIVWGEHKPHLVAIIFAPLPYTSALESQIRRAMPKIGEGLFKIQNFTILPNSELQQTSTMKIKRRATLKNMDSILKILYRES